MTKAQIVARLREAQDLSDQDVALLAASYIQVCGDVPVNNATVAGAMLMLASRPVTPEEAEWLLIGLHERGLVERCR